MICKTSYGSLMDVQIRLYVHWECSHIFIADLRQGLFLELCRVTVHLRVCFEILYNFQPTKHLSPIFGNHSLSQYEEI